MLFNNNNNNNNHCQIAVVIYEEERITGHTVQVVDSFSITAQPPILLFLTKPTGAPFWQF